MAEHDIIIAAEAGIAIRAFDDIADTMAVCYGQAGVIFTEDDLGPDFFELRSGLAGELLQKLVNYQLRAAIVLPNVERYGERFSELAREHRSHNLIRFVDSLDEAQAWLQV